MKYKVIRTETADVQIRKIILHIAENFGSEVALEKLKGLEQSILDSGIHPSKGVEPRYLVLKRQEENKEVVVYAVVDKRQDYLDIIRGL